MIEQIARREKLLLQLLFVLVLAAASWMTAVNISNPLTGSYSFRQTQTALSAYWILKGGPWLNYETPVLGAPWSIPLEFPLYQLLVAAVSHLGVPLDGAGRLVSFVFFLGCLWPLRILILSVDLSELTFWRVAVLFVSSPLYVFWSGSFMMESFALFFSLLWLAFLAKFIRYCQTRALLISMFSGCLAALVKITTFLCFGLVGGIATLVWLASHRTAPTRQHVKTMGGCALIGFVPLILASAWTLHADQVKAMNEFGVALTSSQLLKWNFGSLSQRLNASQWYEALATRTLPHTLGYLWPMAVAVIVIGLVRKPGLGLAACAGFLSLFLLFTNLAFVHDYYPYATALFLVIAVAIAFDGIKNAKLRLGGFVLIAALAANQVVYSVVKYFPIDDFYRWYTSSELGAAEIVKAHTAPGSSILVFGEDWSSILPYLSERKGLAVWDHAISQDRFEKLLSSPQDFLGDAPLGAIVICRDVSADPVRKAEIEKFAAARRIIGTSGACRVVSPEENQADGRF